MAEDFREIPHPEFERDIARLTKAYEKALKEVQAELNSLFLTDFERAQIIATEKQIQQILADLNEFSDEWASASIERAALVGIAGTIYALNLVDTYKEAEQIAKFSRVNKRLIDAAIADTQADLLAVTQNVNRQAKVAIRKATAEAMRAQLAKGVNATDNLSKAIRDRIVKATDVAIIDRAGRRWSVKSYSEMLAREKMKQAHQEASINEALSEGAYYGVISSHGAKDKCRLWESKVVKLVPEAPGDFPYLYDIPKTEFNHVGCKHVITGIRRLDRLPDNVKKKNGI